MNLAPAEIRLKSRFYAAKFFSDLRLDLRFVWYNSCELGDMH